MQPILHATSIKKSFSGAKVLLNAELALYPGEIHALVGENGAGKSTTIKILAGVYTKDSGTILYNGEPVKINSIDDARKLGLAVIYQELSVVKALNAVENIFLGNELRTPFHTLDKSAMCAKTRELLEMLAVTNIPLDVPVSNLSIAQCQLIEIAKALRADAKILILDEPTTALTLDETEALFKVLNKLRSNGTAILYVSHRMEEIFKISDRITVFRDGEYVDCVQTSQVSNNQVISMMVGRDLENMYPKKEREIGPTVLKARNLSRGSKVKDVSFDLHRGELLGIGGLVGAGRSEVACMLAGVDIPESGNVELNGEKLVLRHSSDAIRNKIVFVPEDRKRTGLHVDLSVKDNISLATLSQFEKMGRLVRGLETAAVEQVIEQFHIKASSTRVITKSLSGGNQQKVAIGKWVLVKGIQVFILDEPTRGVDVGAKFEIYKIMEDILDSGASIIMISSDLPELLAMSDRILVMREGVISGELSRDEISEEAVMKLATGGNDRER